MVQVSPSSSLYSNRLFAPESCELNVRPVASSVNRIGSSVLSVVMVPDRSSQAAGHAAGIGGVASSENVRRSASVYAMNIARPLWRLKPTDGSPASLPSALGETCTWWRGGRPLGGVGGGGSTGSTRRTVTVAVVPATTNGITRTVIVVVPLAAGVSTCSGRPAGSPELSSDVPLAASRSRSRSPCSV